MNITTHRSRVVQRDQVAFREGNHAGRRIGRRINFIRSRVTQDRRVQAACGVNSAGVRNGTDPVIVDRFGRVELHTFVSIISKRIDLTKTYHSQYSN